MPWARPLRRGSSTEVVGRQGISVTPNHIFGGREAAQALGLALLAAEPSLRPDSPSLSSAIPMSAPSKAGSALG